MSQITQGHLKGQDFWAQHKTDKVFEILVRNQIWSLHVSVSLVFRMNSEVFGSWWEEGGEGVGNFRIYAIFAQCE